VRSQHATVKKRETKGAPADSAPVGVPLNPTKKQKAKIREDVFNREHGHCQGCGRFVMFSDGHLHHIKSRGAGGSWDLDNLAWLCVECHANVHAGRIKL